MPPLLADVFAQSSGRKESHILASTLASRQDVLSGDQQRGSFDPLVDDNLSSSPTVVGSSPPPSHLKELYSLARLPPPQLPVDDRPHILVAERGPSLTPTTTARQSRVSSARLRRTSEEESFLRCRRPPRPSTKIPAGSDPDEEWTSIAPRARTAPHRAPVKRSGAFRLPLSATGAPLNKGPVTTRVQTFVPPARK
jgi:hypothetical protein